VRDAAILLGAIAGSDDRDPATAEADAKRVRDYTEHLDADGLKGARIGVPRQFFRSGGRGRDVVDNALRCSKTPAPCWSTRSSCRVVQPRRRVVRDHALRVQGRPERLLRIARGQGAGRSLADLIAFNEKNAAKEMPYFGQEIFQLAQSKGP
jgi:amidase